MGKFLSFITFSCLALLIVGTAWWPNNPAFWLASGSIGIQYARIVMMMTLLMQLATRPPRHMLFRAVSGGLAVYVAIWVMQATYINRMQFLDSLSLLGAAVAIGLTALERGYEKQKKRTKQSTYKLNQARA